MKTNLFKTLLLMIMVCSSMASKATAGLVENESGMPDYFFTMQEERKCTTDVPGIYTRDDSSPETSGCRGSDNICYRSIVPCPDLARIVVDMTGDGYFYNQQGKQRKGGRTRILSVERLENYEGFEHNTLTGSFDKMTMIARDPDTYEVYQIVFTYEEE